jgi:hypothetical protein
MKDPMAKLDHHGRKKKSGFLFIFISRKQLWFFCIL